MIHAVSKEATREAKLATRYGLEGLLTSQEIIFGLTLHYYLYRGAQPIRLFWSFGIGIIHHGERRRSAISEDVELAATVVVMI